MNKVLGHSELFKESTSNSQGSSRFNLEALVGFVRRQAWPISFGSAAGLLLALIYAGQQPILYSAKSAVFFDNRRVRTVEDVYAFSGSGDSDSADIALANNITIIKSDKIAAWVADKLNLARDPNFFKAGETNFSKWSKLFSFKVLSSNATPAPEISPEKRRQLAINLLSARLSVQRVPRTQIVELYYSSPRAEEAARVANAFADAVIADQVEVKLDAIRHASKWLEDRLHELKQSLLKSDFAIQKFKADHGIVTAAGNLLDDQKLGDLNTQLIALRAEIAKLEARHKRIKTIIVQHQTDAAVTESFASGLMGQLREKYVNAVKLERELLVKVGPEHLATKNTRREIQEIERLIFEELSREADSYQNELDIDHAREETLKKALDGLATSSTATNLIGLRELERENLSYKSLYSNFLQRYQETLQQQSFPNIDTRIIATATAPAVPTNAGTSRKSLLILLLGTLAGSAFGAAREFFAAGFRTRHQIRDFLGFERIWVLPRIIPEIHDLAPTSKSSGSEGSDHAVGESALGYVKHNVRSIYFETLHAIRLALELEFIEKQKKILGIISIVPGEGKSTLTTHLGSFLALSGSKTLLIDADVRQPQLTKRLAPLAERGMPQAIAARNLEANILRLDPDNRLSILPTFATDEASQASELPSVKNMAVLLDQARDSFDYTLVDLPPLLLFADGQAVAPHVDAFLLVIEFRKTPRSLVVETLRDAPHIRDRCFGAVLNKADLIKAAAYGPYSAQAYYARNYTSCP